jgi:uncharacterized protein (TIGR03435 family)
VSGFSRTSEIVVKHGLVALSCLALFAIPTPRAQDAAGPTFEVASVKKSAPPATGPMMVAGGIRRGDRWFAGYATLRMLIQGAYAPSYQMEGLIVGGPGWINTDRFDIDAKMAPGTTADDMRTMAQALLADRFKLAAHAETRDLQVYALVLARGDGKLGPKMRPSDVDCEALRAARANGTAPSVGPPRAGEPMPPCTTRLNFGPLSRIDSSGMRLAQLVGLLSLSTGRPVVDRTGLSGDFAVSVEFVSEPGAGSQLGPPASSTGAPPPDAPSLFTALQEQLGLKLDSRREPTEVLVIDRAEQPSPD